MTAPIVETLPISPARLSRPNNFVTESAVFLEALPAFRTQVNQLASYINSKIPNKWNFGKVNGIRSFPDISQSTLTDIEYTGDGLDFTSSLDDLYATLKDYSNRVKLAGDWFDIVVAEVGEAPYDLDRSLVSGVTAPMSRTQERSAFNTSAANFSETAVDNINSLYQSIWHTYNTSAGNRNFGSITDTTIISNINGGSITDTNLTY